ncbi:MAG: D-aminoacyl-tRNA deacylase [Thermoplasmata archaeon]
MASAGDPVAGALLECWGTPRATGEQVDGVAIRELAPGVGLLHRESMHIYDDDLDRRLPPAWRSPEVPLVFPSIHRSDSGRPSLTVHPLGNVGPTADVGGRARTLVPTAPRLMTDALRRLPEAASRLDYSVSFEATHHGPALSTPAFFVEIGTGDGSRPPSSLVRAFADLLVGLEADPRDRVVLGVGGGHYAPHFTDLVLRRRWAFGHILSRHALAVADSSTLRAARSLTPGAEGFLTHRAQDAEDSFVDAMGPRLAETEAELRTMLPTSSARTAGT